MLGNVGNDEQPIPPNMPYYRVQSYCPGICTKFFPHPINVFGDFLHTHKAGSMIWSTQYRDNERIPGYFNRIEYWDFSFQDYIPAMKVINPGDRLNLECIFNTMSRSKPTKFGPDSDDEMCLQFLAYYPRLTLPGVNFMSCGSVKGRFHVNSSVFTPVNPADGRNYTTMCFDIPLLPLDENRITLANPLFPQLLGSDGNRTFGSSTECTVSLSPQTGTDLAFTPVFWVIVGLLLLMVIGGIYGTMLPKFYEQEPQEESKSYEPVALEDPEK